MPNENENSKAAADAAAGKAAGKATAKRKPAKKSAKKKSSRKRGSKRKRGAKAATAGEVKKPENTPIPDAALIPRDPPPGPGDVAAPMTQSPKVEGDQTQMIIDILQKRPVEVFLIEAKALVKGAKGRLIFVQGPVSNGLMTVEGARSKFAVLKDGTAVYNAHGFDDVPSTAKDFNLLDVEALIEHNNK